MAKRAHEAGKRLTAPPRRLYAVRGRHLESTATPTGNDERKMTMRLMILIAVLIYWLLPVDIAPGPIDDIIITLAGAVVALAY